MKSSVPYDTVLMRLNPRKPPDFDRLYSGCGPITARHALLEAVGNTLPRRQQSSNHD